MGFFAEFSMWINALLETYVATNTARIAAAIEPALVTLGVVYTMVWGYLMLTGQIEELFVTGLKRILALALILGSAIHLWLFNELIVDTFFNAPVQLAAVIVGAADPVEIVDSIIASGGTSAELLLQKGGLFDGDLSYYLAGIAVYVFVLLTAIYTIFLLTLSRIALSILLALGPLFIGLLLFATTKRFFESWLAQLANYALISVLTVLLAALMLHLLSTSAEQAASLGGGIRIADAARVCMAAGLTFLVLRQVMPMAAGLASGLALSTFGVTSAALAWALGRASGSSRRGVGQFVRGLADSTTTRWDSLSRKAGYYTGRGVKRLLARPNEMRG